MINTLKKKTRCAYSIIESSWAEQRKYIEKAVLALPDELKKTADGTLAPLIPAAPYTERSAAGENPRGEASDASKHGRVEFGTLFRSNGFEFSFGSSGGLSYLGRAGGAAVLRGFDAPLAEYRLYNASGYRAFRKSYLRNYRKNFEWAAPDYTKPGLEGLDLQPAREGLLADRILKIKDNLYVAVLRSRYGLNYGAPKLAEAVYRFEENRVFLSFYWYGKDAVRMPESLWLHIYPEAEDGARVFFRKIGREIDARNVVSLGARGLSAAESVSVELKGGGFLTVVNRHTPLVCLGEGKLLEFDDRIGELSRGLAFNIHNNVWGTNFPQWYGQDGVAAFELSI